MLLNNRIIWLDNTTPKDLSDILNNYKSGTQALAIVAAEDKIFIGGDLPFNHRFFHFSTANTANAKISEIAVWDGDEWKPCVDILDLTLDNTGLKTFSKSGHIMWTPDKNHSWMREDTKDTQGGSHFIDGLGNNGVVIYDMYWVRISFTADLTATLKYVGHKFSSEEDLRPIYPELVLANTKVQFEAGKTDWIDQEFEAAEEIVRDLRKANIIKTPDQILNWQSFQRASAFKCAEIIYRAFGDDYEDNRKTARDYYWEAFKVEVANIDKNKNARLDPLERVSRQGFLTR